MILDAPRVNLHRVTFKYLLVPPIINQGWSEKEEGKRRDSNRFTADFFKIVATLYIRLNDEGHDAVFPLNEHFYAAFYQPLDILRVSINHSFPVETHPDRGQPLFLYGDCRQHNTKVAVYRFYLLGATHHDAVGKIAVLSLLLHGRCLAYFSELSTFNSLVLLILEIQTGCSTIISKVNLNTK